MKKLSFILLGVVIISLSAFSQERRNFTKNVKKVIDEETITFTFDIPLRPGDVKYEVRLYIKNSEITPKGVVGIGENLSSGVQHKIVWAYPADDLTLEEVKKLKIKVITNDPNGKIIHKNAIYTGIGFGLAGLTTSTIGLITFSKNSKSNSDYKVYESNPNPNDPVWQELGYSSRNDLYKTVNGKYKTGQGLAIAGAVIIGVGTFLATKMIKKNNKGIVFYPVLDYNPYNTLSLSNTQYGLGVAVSF